MNQPTNKDEALRKAIAEARRELSGIDLSVRCHLLGLCRKERGAGSGEQGKEREAGSGERGAGRAETSVIFRMFGRGVRFDMQDLTLCCADSGDPVKPGDLLLLLHFLKCDFPVFQTGDLVAFRDFPGGQFYYEPFRSRSTKILLGRFGDDVESLRKNLKRLDYTPTGSGDVGAIIHAFGPLHVALVYRAGDDEFPASADFLFDSGVKRALCAEDAAVIATRVCVSLL